MRIAGQHANERGHLLAAREDAADDLAADPAGGTDHCSGHRVSAVLGSRATGDLAEREDVGLGARGEEGDVKRPVSHLAGLADELVQAPVSEPPGAVLIDVESV